MMGGVQQQDGSGGAMVDRELDLAAIGRALWSKRLWIVGPALAAAVIAFLGVNLIAPRYKSEARVLVDGRENVFLRPEADKTGDRQGVIDAEAVSSQVQLVLSRDLALNVIKQLKLNENPEFDPVLRGVGPLRQVLMMLGILKDPMRMTPEERILDAYYTRLTTYAVDKSRVIAIEFQSTDPELASKIANTVAENYLRLQQSVRIDQTRAASQWLANEIETLRDKVGEAEAKVESFRAKSNLFVGTNNNTLSSQQLGELNSQIGIARSQKAEADARAQSLREMLKPGRVIEAGDAINSELIRRLGEQRATLRAQLAEQSSTLLDQHPRIKELRAQIADIERQSRSEAEKLVRTLENDARIAAARVEQLAANMDQLKRQATSTSEQDVQLRALEREARAQRELLESYLAKYREASARENLGNIPSKARIISHAVVSNTPHFPKKTPIVFIAAIVTLLLAAGVVTVSELASSAPHRVPAFVVRTMLPAPALKPVNSRSVQLEEVAQGPTLAPEDTPDKAPDTLSVREVALKLANAKSTRPVVVVSAHADMSPEGTALALARALPQDRRVVLVELGVKQSGLKDICADPAAPGIAELLWEQASFADILTRDRNSRVHLITAGSMEMDPAATLASETVADALEALSQTYDHVVVTAGPLSCFPENAFSGAATDAVLVLRPNQPVPESTADDLLATSFVSVTLCSAEDNVQDPVRRTEAQAA